MKMNDFDCRVHICIIVPANRMSVWYTCIIYDWCVIHIVPPGDTSQYNVSTCIRNITQISATVQDKRMSVCYPACKIIIYGITPIRDVARC
jgi:hypothetical protein